MNWHTLQPWQWVIAVLAALLVGVSKTGIAGLGMLFVALFALIMPTKQSTGIVLPLLIMGDLIAVLSYRRHSQWSHLWRLFPWTALGVVLGYLAMGHVNDAQARKLIGVLIVGMVALHLWRRRRSSPHKTTASAASPDVAAAASGAVPTAAPQSETEHGAWFAPTVGILAGFTTLVANAAGPLMAIYLLAMRLPKMEFVGTGAVFFMLLNWFKVPFMVNLGLITTESLMFNLLLAPAVFLGTWFGRWVLVRIDQKLFEFLALGMSAAAALKLLL